MGHGAHIAEKLSEIGCECVGFDHRGFGQSEGVIAFIESVELHLHDSRQYLN
jgi:acylglycerol lipase